MVPRALADSRSRRQGTEPSDRLRRLQYFSRAKSGPFRQGEIELLLLRAREGSSRRGQRMAQSSQDAQAPLDSIWPNRVWDSQQIATRIMSFVSFHGAILKQGVGHGLSDGKRLSKYFRL
jgi:hypothetical protein